MSFTTLSCAELADPTGLTVDRSGGAGRHYRRDGPGQGLQAEHQGAAWRVTANPPGHRRMKFRF